MLAHRYQVWGKNWGKDQDPEHDNERRWISVSGQAKRSRFVPFEVYNELVAMRLGQLIGLPVPAGLVVSKDENNYFVSFHMMSNGEDLPAANIEKFCQDKPRDACGVVVFDAWLANGDRRNENMWYDYYKHEFAIFDHGQSLLAGFGENNLNSRKDELGIGFDEFKISHHVTTLVDFSHWYDRICSIPNVAIRSTCQDAKSVLDSSNEHLSAKCAEWLILRRDKLAKMFDNEQDSFPNLVKTVFNPFQRSDDFFPQYCI